MKIVEMTDEEIAELQAAQEAAEREYWVRVDYNEAVNSKIRERYTESLNVTAANIIAQSEGIYMLGYLLGNLLNNEWSFKIVALSVST